MNSVQKIALRFDALLRRELGDDFAVVVEMNKTAKGGICHAHDFCDPNQVLIDAFAQEIGREPVLSSSGDDEADGDFDLMADAYALWHTQTGYQSGLSPADTLSIVCREWAFAVSEVSKLREQHWNARFPSFDGSFDSHLIALQTFDEDFEESTVSGDHCRKICNDEFCVFIDCEAIPGEHRYGVSVLDSDAGGWKSIIQTGSWAEVLEFFDCVVL